RLPADDAAHFLEAAAGDPQLAVHRHFRPARGEPGGRADAMAIAGFEMFAGPAAAHAVEFLADEIFEAPARPAPGRDGEEERQTESEGFIRLFPESVERRG